MAILQQMIIFSLLIIVGAIARKKQIITKENTPQLTALVLNITMPAIILSGITGNAQHIAGRELAEVFVVVAATITLLILSSRILARVLNYGREYEGVIIVMTTFTNISMMGVPMIYSLFGTDAMIYMTAFLLPYNVLFFSFGYRWMRGKSAQQSGGYWQKLRQFLNPGIVACLLALLLYLAHIQLPYLLAQPLHLLGAVTGPMSMMLIGSFLLDMDWREAIGDKKIWLYTFIKMVVIPVVIMLIMKQFVDNRLLLGVLLAAVSTPAGAGVPLLAQALNKNAYPLALKGAALTTIAALLTMPIVAAITELN
ncbi:Auxin Efflux Carrier [Dickeya parazeae Ech586]|uniref:Auxin Efflux Carrier n=1 Tax=Dickeya zeae (strain Ech586) TaxID=590409 RepID=D2BSS8_DICZ5|nr:AEC family transporter [Dickeya parazeae]ACZ77691.1 Auxin Efflux Carrier [Dickeya parazeae Ech586]